MKAIFITGTDTGVGKSVVTGLLGRYLQNKGLRVVTQKWIQTGCRLPEDIHLHLKLMGLAQGKIKNRLLDICPYIFKLGASPHLAAQTEARKISTAKIKDSFNKLCADFDFVLVEGVGGALVPLDSRRLVIDLVRELDLPVLVVAQNKLGAINQVLMTMEALKNRKLKILGVIFNNLKNQNAQILKDNPRIIKKFTQEKILGVLPWNRNNEALYKRFSLFAGEIYK